MKDESFMSIVDAFMEKKYTNHIDHEQPFSRQDCIDHICAEKMRETEKYLVKAPSFVLSGA